MEEILSGRCKEDFEEWLELDDSKDEPTEPYWLDTFDVTRNVKINMRTTDYFQQLPFSMRYGVYVDWFDSVGIRFEVSCIIDFFDKDCYQFSVHHGATQYYIEMTIKRNDGAKKAIEKANDIYNEHSQR